MECEMEIYKKCNNKKLSLELKIDNDGDVLLNAVDEDGDVISTICFIENKTGKLKLCDISCDLEDYGLDLSSNGCIRTEKER